MTCTRPTGPAGDALGYTYGAATVQSFSNASVVVWYTTTGVHAVNPATTRTDGVPDDVAEVAQATSDALASYATMGYRAPVSDMVANTACGDYGGDGRLDVYLVHMTGGDGTTVAEPDRCVTTGQAQTCAGYILAQANFAGLYASASEGIHTVLPHETFHTVQNAYASGMESFWAEGTAQWAAKTLDPSLMDLERFLPAFFSDTSRSLDSSANGVSGSYAYGAAIWPVFLTQRHGNDVVRAIFDQQAATGANALPATDTVLQTMQSSMAVDYPLFAQWNAATGARAPVSGGYPEAATYPSVDVTGLTDAGAQGITSGYASFYYQYQVAGTQIISIDTDATRNTAVAYPRDAAGNLMLDQAAPLPVESIPAEQVIVVSGITGNKSDAPFSLSIADAPTRSSTPDGGCTIGGMSSPSLALVLMVVALRRKRRRGRSRRALG